MPRTDNPLADFESHDAECSRWLASRPECSICGEPIQEDTCFEINDEVICEDCLNDNYRKAVEDIVP